jgi:hypothetical protein
MIADEPMTGGHKANFDNIYDQEDPRGYFRTLGHLDYQIPQQARPVIERVHAAAGRERTILDVCCSYGINAALLRHDLDIGDLIERYTDSAVDDLPIAERIAADRAFFADRARVDGPTVLGLDAAPNAIKYAKRVDLLSAGWAADLESNEAPAELAAGVRDVGMIVCTGGVGYIGAPTFARLLALTADPSEVWLTVFVLRTFPYDEIAAALDEFGLVTEQVPDRTYPQRRFASDDEQQAALHDVVARGLDPAGKEAEGWFHADCYITRPVHVAAQTPVEQLVGG